MVVFDLVIRLINVLLVPAVCAYLAVVAVDAATGNGMLHGIADGIKGLTSGALKPVSYTHLDVYKRQGKAAL